MTVKLSDHFTYQRLLHFCLPPMAMMVFTSIYGVIDGLFVSNFVGKTAFAAINLVLPFILILGGFGFMIGTGGSALVAKTLGEGKVARANDYFTMLIFFTVISGVLLSLMGIVFMRPIAYFLGATEAMITDCVLYGRLVLIFNTAFMLQNAFQTFLATAERPKLGLFTTIIAGITNIVLDALFIVGFGWGVEGAAVATGISECVGGLIPLLYFLRPNDSLLRLVKTKIKLRVILKACGNGASELMSNVSSSLVSMVYNVQLINLIGENGVAAYGVLMYVSFIFVAIFIGYTVGTAPIISYHYGAGNHKELKNLLLKSTFLTLVAGILMALVAQVLAGPLAHLFVGYDQELFTLTKHAFRTFFLLLYLSR